MTQEAAAFVDIFKLAVPIAPAKPFVVAWYFYRYVGASKKL